MPEHPQRPRELRLNPFLSIEEVVLDSSICGRVVLLGDAAHATSPNMAEGASMALEDALVLAQMLAMHGSPDEALSAFSERRRTRIRWVQQRTHRRDRIRALPVPLRNLALRLAGTAIYQRDYRGVVRETIAGEWRRFADIVAPKPRQTVKTGSADRSAT